MPDAALLIDTTDRVRTLTLNRPQSRNALSSQLRTEFYQALRDAQADDGVDVVILTGADPVLMLTGPIPATEKVLHKAGVRLEEVGVFEVNEAFAPVPLAWLAETGADGAKLNPLGGAIALGHPLGASGAVLMTRMINHMRDKGIQYGLQTMCEGGGTANATLVELIA